MSLSWGDILTWSAGGMGQAAGALRAVVGDLVGQAEDLAKERAGHWRGPAATAARTQQGTLVGDLQAHHSQLRTVVDQLDKAADELAALRREVDATLSLAGLWQFSISPDGQVHDQAILPTFIGDQQQLEYLGHRAWQRAELVAMVTQAVAKATSLDHGLQAALTRAAAAQCQAPSSVTELDLHLVAAMAKSGRGVLPSDPTQLAAFWATLTDWERNELIQGDPQWWGNLNGVPARYRDQANQAVLQRELGTYAQWFRHRGLVPPQSVGELERYWAGFTGKQGTNPDRYILYGDRAEIDALLRRYRVALSTWENLNSSFEPTVPTHLWAYNSAAFDGKGRVAIAYGADLDSVDNLAVVVAGLDSNAAKMDQIGVNAARLQHEATQADPGATTAVIAWQGYDAPEKLDVASQAKAAAGATLLAADVAAMRATSRGASNVSVVAHSYGSTTASLALQRDGMAKHVDQVVLLGSPGAGGHASSVRELNLRRDQVYVASASRDPVTRTYRVHGADPAHQEFGATRFKAEHQERDASPVNWFDDHSRYFDRSTDSESLYAMGLIVTGQGTDLGGHDMLADPRRTVVGRTEVVSDPERARPPTAGHVHD